MGVYPLNVRRRSGDKAGHRGRKKFAGSQVCLRMIPKGPTRGDHAMADETKKAERITEEQAEQWLRAMRGGMLKAARARGMSDEEAEDCAQEASYRAWEMAPTVFDASTGRRGFRLWAMQFLHNAVGNLSRKAYRRYERPYSPSTAAEMADQQAERQQEGGQGDPLAILIAKEEARGASDALAALIGGAGLSPRQRECVGGVLDGDSYSEIAGAVGISNRCVAAHVHNATVKMKAAAAAAGEGE